jgi:hypothetical protein
LFMASSPCRLRHTERRNVERSGTQMRGANQL